MAEQETKHRICPICEAAGNLEAQVDGSSVINIRGDSKDVLSRGHICPKVASVKELNSDPDQFREPLVRRGGILQPASWEEAFAEINRRLPPILSTYGPPLVEITDTIMPGVVSLPRGWGHDARNTRLRVAAERPGVSANQIIDDTNLETLTGDAVFNGVPITVVPVPDQAVAVPVSAGVQ